VKAAEEVRGDWPIVGAGMEEVEGEPVAPDLFLRTVARSGVLEHQRDQPVRRHGHPLDPVRGLDALDQSGVAEPGEQLRCLPNRERLPALGLRDVGQQPDRAQRYREAFEEAASEGVHVEIVPSLLPAFERWYLFSQLAPSGIDPPINSVLPSLKPAGPSPGTLRASLRSLGASPKCLRASPNEIGTSLKPLGVSPAEVGMALKVLGTPLKSFRVPLF